MKSTVSRSSLVLGVLLFFSAQADDRCDGLAKDGEFFFSEGSPSFVGDIYRMPRDSSLRDRFAAETANTQSRIGMFKDAGFRKFLVDTRRENEASRASSISVASNEFEEMEINGLTYRFENSPGFIPNVSIRDESGTPITKFNLASLAIAISDEEDLVPLHLSPDGKTLVLALDRKNRDRARLFFFRNVNGETVAHQEFSLDPAYFPFSWYGSSAGFWTNDSRSYFIATQGDAQRPGRLLRYDREESGRVTQTVAFQNQPNADLYLDLQASPDRGTLIFTTYHYGGYFSSQVYDLRTGRLMRDTTKLAPRRGTVSVALPAEGGFVRVDSRADHRFEVTRERCSAGCCDSLPSRSNREADTVLASVKDFTLDAKVALDHAFFVGYGRGHARLAAYNLKTGETRVVELPEGTPAAFAGIGGTAEFPVIRLSQLNPLQQSRTLTYDFKTGALTASAPAIDYSSTIEQREWMATSADGTAIPVTLFYAKGMNPNPESKLMVYFYGEYGTPTFARWYGIDTVVPLVKQGWVVAFPHIRGSSDFGNPWYLGGTRANKVNGLADAQASLRMLHATGVSTPDRTAIKGMSAGGIMMTLLLEHSPDLFKVAFLEWPIVDTLNGTKLPGAPIDSKNRWAIGNPDFTEERDFVCGFSGIQRLKRLPARNRVWITTSYGDTNVVPQPVYALYRSLTEKYPDQVYFYGGTSGEHLSLSSDEEMLDFLALEIGWAEAELR